tara:strand:+ start:1520 stop:1861 length:342 start_codon:yes stop_codon:yes gene_type:complete
MLFCRKKREPMTDTEIAEHLLSLYHSFDFFEFNRVYDGRGKSRTPEEIAHLQIDDLRDMLPGDSNREQRIKIWKEMERIRNEAKEDAERKQKEVDRRQDPARFERMPTIEDVK